jgi:hypothetical protein
MNRPIAAAASLLIVVGCASPSAIAPYGKDSYIVTVDDPWGGHSPGKLQVRAAQEANHHCAKSGKVLRVRNTAERGTPGWTTTASTLIFSCIDPDDTENTRPELRKE